jgi:4-hydroxythreonine-4-phosphate dehydrogenase
MTHFNDSYLNHSPDSYPPSHASHSLSPHSLRRPRPFAITMGDPAGIGPEIIVKFAALPNRPLVPLVVIGDLGRLQHAATLTGTSLNFEAIPDLGENLEFSETAEYPPKLYVLQTGPALPLDLPFGRVDAQAGRAAFRYIERAIDLTKTDQIAAIITAPIHKKALAAADVPYPGHTEILAAYSGTHDFGMMLATNDLRVLLVSIHLSLADAVRAVTLEAELRTIRLAHAACQKFGIAQPRIAVAGLNPHAGEDGLFGREDLDIIAPAIRQAQAEGIAVTGPWPGDTVFMRARQGDFDVVVAQYHDQGLIPIKYLGLDQGVNITVGLPFIRTSVDHGTAFDIAGTGTASPTSLLCAVRQAMLLAKTS